MVADRYAPRHITQKRIMSYLLYVCERFAGLGGGHLLFLGSKLASVKTMDE